MWTSGTQRGPKLHNPPCTKSLFISAFAHRITVKSDYAHMTRFGALFRPSSRVMPGSPGLCICLFVTTFVIRLTTICAAPNEHLRGASVQHNSFNGIKSRCLDVTVCTSVCRVVLRCYCCYYAHSWCCLSVPLHCPAPLCCLTTHPSIDIWLVIAAFSVGTLGTNQCPAGFGIVGTEAECQEAATALSTTAACEVLKPDGNSLCAGYSYAAAGDFPNYPTGCFIGGAAFRFNTNGGSDGNPAETAVCFASKCSHSFMCMLVRVS